VTEPPEPRRPEDGGGEDDYLGELEDDIDLDALGRGEDPEGELGDMLGAWRDDVESEPVPPIAERAQEIHELNQQYDASPTQEGTPMSASDEAARLRQIAGDTAALGMLQGVMQALDESRAEVQNALGDGHSRLADALAPFESAKQAVEQLQGVIAAAYENLNGIAGQIG
jgi:hypothetical protein